MIVKHKQSGRLYEVDYIVHPNHCGDVLSGHMLSAYDGMPIGERIWLPVSDFIDPDQQRLREWDNSKGARQ